MLDVYSATELLTFIVWDDDVVHINCPVIVTSHPGLVKFIKWDTDML